MLKALVFQLLESKVLSSHWFQNSLSTRTPPTSRLSKRHLTSSATSRGGAEVQADPSFESSRFQNFDCEKDTIAFNLNPFFSELAPLQRGASSWTPSSWGSRRPACRWMNSGVYRYHTQPQPCCDTQVTRTHTPIRLFAPYKSCVRVSQSASSHFCDTKVTRTHTLQSDCLLIGICVSVCLPLPAWLTVLSCLRLSRDLRGRAVQA